ncbi:hypothetical protein D9757_002437 [Collybiopsis confluens]|uniref:Cytosolic endo-beta-N-acetylglucosaminidase TIM barrel domain-containing protein n=1 Tax=Collybiopsis confluens TaxID=2823264 RepID=A0A8H5HXQ7_9AGAR|nr:hypothetical protein D9757_002437 [Collybiopsis confluens]
MPVLGNPKNFSAPKGSFFDTLADLDSWTDNEIYDNILPFTPRARGDEQRGKLLICHDYKGGYTESPYALSYTFNFWSSCEVFVYFSHHRVTIPPPGWINASHRQGVKMLGTLIFEGGGEQDCLRLLVGQLPKSRTGPVSRPQTTTSLPISPHYARVLADLAKQRGFDGYLLNFECPLAGGLEQTRALAGWITLLRSELRERVGAHTEVSWYDSVVINGQLAWQDRLNSYNLPFFLSSSSFFSNYTWRSHYPLLTAQYFLSLDPALTGDGDLSPHIDRKKLQDLYIGVDVWGRGSHGNGGFGSFRAISHIAPSSLGLSVALFGQAWTWESEQDKPGWDWDAWWAYERKLWTGKADSSEEITVPNMTLKNGEAPCEPGVHDVFTPLVSHFERVPPPDPKFLPFHTTFSPGAGKSWFVKGEQVFHRAEGWTDVDKQTSLGDLMWPKPAVDWDGEAMDPEGLVLPETRSQIFMNDAWNGGSSLRVGLRFVATHSENAAFRSIWLPVQSLTVTPERLYEASVVYKLESEAPGVDMDIALSMKTSLNSPSQPRPEFKISSSESSDLGRGWTSIKLQFSLPSLPSLLPEPSSIGLVITLLVADTTQPLEFGLLLGQLNVYPSLPPDIPPHVSSILWADFQSAEEKPGSSSSNDTSLGVLSWEVAASFPPFRPAQISSPDDPIQAWPGQPSAEVWFPKLLYSNIYMLEFREDGTPGDVDNAIWIGTSGCDYEGMRNRFTVEKDIDLSASVRGNRGAGRVGSGKTRFYVQGVTDEGEVIDWTRCAFVDA